MNIKTLSAISVSAVVLALTAGCGSDSNDDDGGTVTPPPPTTTGGDTTGGGGGIPANSGGGDSGIGAVIFDRMGRPGVSTALIAAADQKDAYNLSGNPADWSASFLAPLTERIEIVDGLDGTVGNALLDAGTLAGLLVDDRLQIDTSRPDCEVYLALEIGLGGCGGRTLQSDVIDDTLRHLVSQDMPVSDLADGATDIANISAEWPFLGTPNP